MSQPAPSFLLVRVLVLPVRDFLSCSSSLLVGRSEPLLERSAGVGRPPPASAAEAHAINTKSGKTQCSMQ